MRTTTYLLSIILIFVLTFAVFIWLDSDAEAAGGVKGGPYWNAEVYRQQQQQRQYKNNLQTQQLMMNNIRIQQANKRLKKSTIPRSRYYKVRPAPSNGYNYRRANEK